MADTRGWRTMETAPRDGTLLWLLVDGAVVVGYFRRPFLELEGDTGEWKVTALIMRRECFEFDDRIVLTTVRGVQPTRWMPFPTPPEDTHNG